MKTLFLVLVLALVSNFALGQVYLETESPTSSFSGDEYYFSVFVYPFAEEEYRVYCELELLFGGETLYQLDPVRPKKDECIWYSCRLDLLEVGTYFVHYYVVDDRNVRFDLNQDYAFVVYGSYGGLRYVKPSFLL